MERLKNEWETAGSTEKSGKVAKKLRDIKKRNSHVDQANPVVLEALALLVDPDVTKEKQRMQSKTSNRYKLLLLIKTNKQTNKKTIYVCFLALSKIRINK